MTQERPGQKEMLKDRLNFFGPGCVGECHRSFSFDQLTSKITAPCQLGVVRQKVNLARLTSSTSNEGTVGIRFLGRKIQFRRRRNTMKRTWPTPAARKPPRLV